MLPPMFTKDPMRPPYAYALVGIVAVIVLSAASGQGGFLGALALLVEGAVLIFVLEISDVHPRVFRVAAVLTVVLVVAGMVTALFKQDSAADAYSAIGTIFAVVTPLAILRRAIAIGVVNGPVVAGALCVYLLVGLFFAQLYGLIDKVEKPFFVQTESAEPVDFIYFSYVTMTTVGYGDLTARSDLGRTLAITEALTGQLYLVTIVALTVSRLGRLRDRGRGERAEGDDP
jgi:ion channel